MKTTLCALGVTLLVLLGTAATASALNKLDRIEKASAVALSTVFDTAPDAVRGEDSLRLAIEIFIAILTADGPGADLLNFTTAIAVGVERSSIGSQDNPLTDFKEFIEARYGVKAAAVVDQFFQGLVETLGPKLLADVEPIIITETFDVDNGRADFAIFDPSCPYILDIGNTHRVGDGEFARVVLGLVDCDADDNDAEQLLTEIITGTSGANLDFEWQPGIVGVDLVDISFSEFTLVLEDGNATDQLTFAGPGAEAVIAKLDTPANLADFRNALSLVEVGAEHVELGRRIRNPIFDLVGSSLDSGEDVVSLLDAARSGDQRIELIGSHDSSISLIVRNRLTRTSDILILFGDAVEGALSRQR